MKIPALILDDDANSRLSAAMALLDYPEISVEGQFASSSELFLYLSSNKAELLFLDIELDEETGFEIAQRLRKEYPEIMIVFLTGHSSYAIDGYDFQPVNFLTKPINPVKLRQTVDEVKSRLNRSDEEKGQSAAKLMFHLQQGYRIVDVRDICYIERLNRKNYLYTESEAIRITNQTMRELEEMLSTHNFFLCHQSFIVSLHRVISVKDVGRQLYEVKLKGCDRALPVSRNRYEELMKRLQSII